MEEENSKVRDFVSEYDDEIHKLANEILKFINKKKKPIGVICAAIWLVNEAAQDRFRYPFKKAQKTEE